jgi:RNA polymerase sigma-70 factor, ECF subfamily
MNRMGPDQAQRFLELLEPIEAELEAYARRMLWDPQETRDTLHNALARAMTAFDRYHDGTNFRAWMFKILTHEIFAANRKHQLRAAREFQMDLDELAQCTANPSTDGADVGEDHLDDKLVYALRCLTEPERATLLLRSMGGFTYQEIGEHLDMPLGSVMGYLGRARRKMRLLLARSVFSRKER